jgi:hypothetical protein
VLTDTASRGEIDRTCGAAGAAGCEAAGGAKAHDAQRAKSALRKRMDVN